MRERAFQVYSQFRSGNTPIPGVLSTGRPDYGEDELALFGGQTRVLVSRILSQSQRNNRKSSSGTGSTSPSAASSPSRSDSNGRLPSNEADIHPSLVDYLSMFPPPKGSPSPSQTYSEPNYPEQATLDTSHSQSPLSILPTQSASQGDNLWSPQWSGWPNQNSVYGPEQSNQYPQPGATFSAFSQLHPTSLPSAPSFNMETDQFSAESSQVNFVDLMMLTGESGIDEQWVSFMRDSGFLGAANSNSQGDDVSGRPPAVMNVF